MTNQKSAVIAEALFGFIVLALGLFIGIETTALDASPKYAVVGPKIFPTIVAIGLVIVGGLCVWDAFKGKHEVPEEQFHFTPVIWIAIGLVIEMFLIEKLGWVVASAVLFVIIARAFASPSIIRDIAFGLVLGGATYFIFNQLLGLSLPVGALFETVFPQ